MLLISVIEKVPVFATNERSGCRWPTVYHATAENWNVSLVGFSRFGKLNRQGPGNGQDINFRVEGLPGQTGVPRKTDRGERARAAWYSRRSWNWCAAKRARPRGNRQGHRVAESQHPRVCQRAHGPEPRAEGRIDEERGRGAHVPDRGL